MTMHPLTPNHSSLYMKKSLYLSAILVSIFYSIAANAAVGTNSATSLAIKNSAVCGKHVIKDDTITIQCDFPESKERISTVLSGSLVFSGITTTETKDDIDWIHLQTLIVMKNGNKSQEINLGSVETAIRLYGFNEAVKLMDLNFDGYDDIQLWKSPTASVNASYEYWLYNPKTSLFDATDLGEKLFGFDVTPDSKTQTIFIKSHSGCCYNNETTYHWVGNELRKKTNLYYGVIDASDKMSIENVVSACGQTITHYNDNEEILRMDVEPSSYCKGDEHNAPMSLEPFLSKLKNEEKDGNYVLKKKASGKYTVIYKNPNRDQ